MARAYYFIVNPSAGKGRHLSYIRDIENFCARKGLHYEIAITKKQSHAIEIARQASAHFPTIVAVGGDGTAHEVVNGMFGSSAVLGVLPMGSGNDFAHQLGYGRNVDANLRIIAEGKIKRIDVGQVDNSRYMINGCSLGFDGEVTAHFREYTKFINGFPAYLLSVIRTLPVYQFKSAQIILDDSHTIISKVLLVAVCNGTTYGGGFKVAPSAKMDDGVLTICVVKKTGKFYALRKLLKFMRGTHVHLPEVETYTAKKVEISITPASIGQIDGEVVQAKKSFSVKILKNALSVITK
jgi:YegS/Rv2252/BmrU family lipid kinase